MEPIRRFLIPPARSFFLFGPRGTGKSTWLDATFPEALRVDLLDLAAFRAFQARPERLAEVVEGNPRTRTVVIDEVQKVPELLSTVHRLMERHKAIRFVLTGSSARKIRRSGVNLLAGRASWRTMHPFVAAELGDRFRLSDALRYGLVPLVVADPDPAEALRGYAALYLREEVQAEGLVRNLGAFARFLEAASFSHASILNVSNIARECEVERKVVEGYIGILEDLLLAFRLPVFSRRAGRATTVRPKFYFFDAGVFRSLRPSGPLDHPEAIEGAALEGLVAQHLRAWISWDPGAFEISFWRSRGGVEVDFVLYGPGGFWAIEVKNTDRIRPDDLRGLRAFCQDYPHSRPILVYRGRERLRVQEILCIPCEEFLLGLRPGRVPGDPVDGAA